MMNQGFTSTFHSLISLGQETTLGKRRRKASYSNRCKDECLPEETNRRIVDIISDVNMAYSEHARRYLADTGLPKERTYVTGSPMAEVLHNNLKEIEASDIHQRLAA